MLPVSSPVLSDGSLLPSSKAQAVLRAWDRSAYVKDPHGRRSLWRSLLASQNGEATESELDAVISELLDDHFIEMGVAIDRRIKMPKLPNLPGVPQLKIDPPRYAHDPDEGETCYILTLTGQKVARICTALVGGTQALWLLGPTRQTDQVLMGVQPMFASTADDIEVACGTLSRESVAKHIEQLCREGLLTLEDGSTPRFRLTAKGDARHAKALADLQLILSGTQTLPSTLPPPPHVIHLQTKLDFISTTELRTLIVRDLTDLDTCLRAGVWKAALMLTGSILEAILLDVLNSRPSIAETYMGKKKWPDDASLPKLIEIATDYKIAMQDGSTARLLSSTNKPFATSITDHRDLIHPRAEIRGSAIIDADTAHMMASTLRVIVRDLDEAYRNGIMQAYSNA